MPNNPSHLESCVVLACCLLAACGPKAAIVSVNMPVGHFHPGSWEAGAIKNCEKNRFHDRELLLCDIEEFTARFDSLSGQPQANALLSEFRSDIDEAQMFAVTFHTRKDEGLFWRCERTAEGIDCR